MARKTRMMVTITDDLDGKEQPEGQGSTVPFVWEGKSLEIDLSDANTKKFHDLMRPYVEAARKVKNSPAAAPAGAPRKRGTGTGSGLSKEESDTIRTWARANGHAVADSGVIPKKVREAYDQRDSVPMIPQTEATPAKPAGSAPAAPKPGPVPAPPYGKDKEKVPAK